MARVKQTEEEKAAKALARKLAAKQKKQDLWNEKVKGAQAKTLSLMDEKDQKLFEKDLFNFTKDPKNYSQFINSIFFQFRTFGNLSEKQVNWILLDIKKRRKEEIEKVFYNEYVQDQNYDLSLKFLSSEFKESDSQVYGHFNTSHTVIKFVNDANQCFKIMTNNKTLIRLFSEEGKWYSLNAKIRFVAEGNKYIILSPKDIKLCS